MLELPRRLPQHDPGADRKIRPSRRRQAALAPLLERGKAAGARLLRGRGRPDQGYGWQYIYLFFRTQEEAKRFTSENAFEDFTKSIAGGVEELDIEEWESDLEENGGSDGAIQKRLEGYEELGRNLGIRIGQGMIVSGPSGTKTLQEGPSLAEVETAIAEVE